MPRGWIEQRLERGQCLILLDGLDEVADTTLRQQMLAWVQQQMTAYGNNRFIITSRPFGYRSNPLSRVTILELQPFTIKQVKMFVNNWYLANEIKSAVRDDPGVRMRADEGAQDLLRRSRETPALYMLAVNPLLLTMIATVHRYRGSLPGARVMLYKEIFEVFLGKRQEARGLIQELRADQRQLALQPLAYHMMLQGKKDIGRAEAEQTITQALQRVNTEITPQAFLQSIEDSSGLLLEREMGTYAFAHLTFQEYLAAVHIRENALEHILISQKEESWWHETIRLYCAQADATSIIIACLAERSPSIAALTLASGCLEEARDVEARVKHQFNLVIDQSSESIEPERYHLAAEVLLSRRLSQMYSINEQTSIDTSLITHVEYQLFLDEKRGQGKYYQPDHWKDLSFPSGTGRQPVLGVRLSDALAFCEWLTLRNGGNWYYRLPKREEYERKDLQGWRTYDKEKIGYWADGNPNFVWLSKGPPQFLQDFFHTLTSRTLTLGTSRDLDFASIRDLDLAHDLARNLNHTYDLAHGLHLAYDFARYRTLAHELACALDRGLSGTIPAYTRIRDLARSLINDLVHARSINRDLISDLHRTRTNARDGNVALARAHNLDLGLTRAHTLDHTLTQNLDQALNLYATILLMQERSEGRFPAYEGIRLVREQMRE